MAENVSARPAGDEQSSAAPAYNSSETTVHYGPDFVAQLAAMEAGVTVEEQEHEQRGRISRVVAWMLAAVAASAALVLLSGSPAGAAPVAPTACSTAAPSVTSKALMRQARSSARSDAA